jgi:hypothetical protein
MVGTNMKKITALLLCVVSGFFWSTSALAKPGDAINYLQVQDGGRIKPYDSFAREMLEIVYGKSKYEGRAATEIVLTWMLSPQAWQGKKIFEVRNHQVLEAMKLPKDQRWFSGDEIFGNERFSLLRQELQAKLVDTQTNLFFTKDINPDGTLIDESAVRSNIATTVADLLS